MAKVDAFIIDDFGNPLDEEEDEWTSFQRSEEKEDLCSGAKKSHEKKILGHFLQSRPSELNRRCLSFGREFGNSGLLPPYDQDDLNFVSNFYQENYA